MKVRAGYITSGLVVFAALFVFQTEPPAKSAYNQTWVFAEAARLLNLQNAYDPTERAQIIQEFGGEMGGAIGMACAGGRLQPQAKPRIASLVPA